MISAKVDNKTRKAVYARDGYMCAVCGDTRNLQIHHAVHRSLGGGNTPQNLITLCQNCHALAHGTNLRDADYFTSEDVEQAVVEYLADYYVKNTGEPWDPYM